MRRGDICWVDFGDPAGSAPAYRRPAAVISSDRFNRSRIAMVTVAAVTSTMRLADAPGNLPLDPAESGLPKPSVVNVSQILTVDQSLVAEQVGSLTPARLQQLDAGLRLALDL